MSISPGSVAASKLDAGKKRQCRGLDGSGCAVDGIASAQVRFYGTIHKPSGSCRRIRYDIVGMTGMKHANHAQLTAFRFPCRKSCKTASGIWQTGLDFLTGDRTALCKPLDQIRQIGTWLFHHLRQTLCRLRQTDRDRFPVPPAHHPLSGIRREAWPWAKYSIEPMGVPRLAISLSSHSSSLLSALSDKTLSTSVRVASTDRSMPSVFLAVSLVRTVVPEEFGQIIPQPAQCRLHLPCRRAGHFQPRTEGLFPAISSYVFSIKKAPLQKGRVVFHSGIPPALPNRNRRQDFTQRRLHSFATA